MYQSRTLPTELRVSSYSRESTSIERLFYGRIVRQLVERRIAIGLTQEQLDTELGMSEGQVAKWETFRRLPGAFMFVCWSNRLGLSLSLEVGALEAESNQAQGAAR